MNTLSMSRTLQAALLAGLSLLAPHVVAQNVVDPDVAQMPPPAPRSSEAVRKLTPAELLAELRRGGYVIYFRHTSTDFSQNDLQSKGYQDCAHQRNLTDAGRAQARAIGAAIRDLKLPIAKVLASPMCRTMETARLVFGMAEPVPEMRGAAVPVADPNRYAALKKLFATPYPRGENLAVASHGNPFYGAAGPPYLAEGEGAVIRGLGNDFEIVARIRVDDWRALTAVR
ncbi:MAG TPA: histidine phosphatase family protein [Burkholderiales bacterium]|nr:histidine phosphatase family protein [Burkholderiales bacterium]